jgi:NAD(P)-dependent dehydrogenase (short-subunit alcohol dehydrogenase family)
LPTTANENPTVLVTGSNRGIGFEFVRQYAALGWNVIATCRNPDNAEALRALAAGHENVRIEQIDVTDHAMIDRLAARLESVPLDLLVNNAGVFGDFPDQFFGKLRHDQFDLFMRVNALGPLKMAEALYENLKASEQKKVVNITSLAGSFGARSGGMPQHFWYKGSKAAQNMFTMTLAETLRRRGITVVAMSPGTVRTERLEGINMPGLIEPEESIAGMIEVIEGLTIEDTGTFVRYNGEPQPW